MSDGNWQTARRRGYCYHSPVLRYKTTTLVEKWRDSKTSAHKRKVIAYELSFRDPALALAEVKQALAAPNLTRAQRKVLRLCLHHVADADTARALVADEDFDPDALHLSAFAALLDDLIADLPDLDSATADQRATKLGFLTGPVPDPIIDGPVDSEAYHTSHARYEQVLIHFLEAALESAALAHARDALAEHLRCTFKDVAYEILFDRWLAQQLPAVAVVAGLTRLSWDRANELLDGQAPALVDAFVRELGEEPYVFEQSALDNGWLPAAARRLPEPQSRAIALAFLDQPRLADAHAAAAKVLLAAGGEREVLDRAAHLPGDLIAKVAAALPYAEARERLQRAGLAIEHMALVDHPQAPPDLELLARGTATFATQPGQASEQLIRVARDLRHPHREVAITFLLETARTAGDVRVRRYALYALGRIGDRRAEPVLRAALTDPALPDVEHLVNVALAGLGG